MRSAANGNLIATVSAGCLSSSCDRTVAKSCRFERDGSSIVIHSELVIDREGGVCTDDCVPEHISCELAALEEGQYTVRYRDSEETIRHSVGTTVLLGEEDPGVGDVGCR